MKLTIKEAEGILSKVFSTEIGQGGVQIEPNSDDEIRHTNSDFYISETTLNRVLGSMARQGLKIEAIKLYREVVSGSGLAAAKSYIENLMGNQTT
jgi:ribosomal protein L7/L12